MTQSLVRLGDIIRHWGSDHLFIGHEGTATDPICWKTRSVPLGFPDEVYECNYPYDFAERDLAAPGGLIGFADTWSTWTEGAVDAARGEQG